MELLKDTNIRWLIEVTTFIVVGAIPVVVNLFAKRNSRRLWYKRWNYPVIDENEKNENYKEMEISFGGESFPNAYISVVGLRYEGAEPITEDD